MREMENKSKFEAENKMVSLKVLCGIGDEQRRRWGLYIFC